MKVSNSVEQLNPYEWLPPYGESSVKFEAIGLDLNVSIAFDRDNRVETKELLFKSACFFTRDRFLGH